MLFWDRPPNEEIGKRAAEAGGGLAAAAKTIAVDNMRRNAYEHRQRVRNSHLAEMKYAGFDVPAPDITSEETMGDMLVTGDVYGDGAIAALRKVQASSQTSTPQQPSMSTAAKIVTALVAAALIGPGAIATAGLFGAFNAPESKPAQEYVDTDTDTATTVSAVQLYQPNEDAE